ncbi:MAG: hypothetical protein ACPH5P_02210 [Akkermansiaceae bacterium]
MVTSVGIALLILLISMYENTVQAHAVQKNSLLKNDYQQREDAFLRALTNIIPNRAILCMQDNSMDASIQESLKWQSIINEALVLSNSRQALSADVASLLGVANARSGNNTDSNLEQNTIINALNAEAAASGAITSGTNLSATSEYPPPLECSATAHLDDTLYPIISLEKKYGSSAEGWVQAPVSDFPLYNLIDAPELHFNYQNGDTIIAKHNWWAFEMSFASQDASMTKVITRKKKYLVSLYEIPSQLPISASAFTTFGTHSDGTEWANVSLQGSIFAEKVKTEGTFSTDAIAARKGVELSSATIISGSLTGSETGANPFASNARELSETAGNVFPISSSSDGGRVCFVPINRGLDFYDRWTGDPDQESASSNAVSPTSWDYYSIGAKQCAMHLDVIDVVSGTDQTPMAIRFSYWKDAGDDGVAGNLERVFVTFSKNPEGTEQLWPSALDPGGDTFPFHIDISYSGRPCIAIYGERLANWLINDNAAPLDINHSIAVNVDHINNVEIPKPPFPSEVGDLAVMFMDAKNLTTFTDGFSLVTNMRLIFTDDINITPTTAPAGLVLPAGEDFYPPVSFFAPEKRFGDSGIALKIDLDGQLGSLAKDNVDPVRIADLKSGYADQIVPENITANLKTINHPAALPPVNMMNWMVVIREIHPKYNP